MNKKQIWFVAICALVCIAVAILGICSQMQQQAPAPLVATLQGDPPPQGGCSQCLAGNCYQANCNLECRLLAVGCETIVMGGAQQEYSPKMRGDISADYAEFFMQQVVKNNKAMESAGVNAGDLIVKVNDVYAGSDLEFAKLVLKLPRGTKLSIWRARTGEKLEVVL